MQGDERPAMPAIDMAAVVEYAWAHLEHHIDSVRHNTKDFLNNLIRYSYSTLYYSTVMLVLVKIGPLTLDAKAHKQSTR